jgi:uncharacterized damage-inducible protein DinB
MSCPQTEYFVKNWNRIHKQTARVLKAAPDAEMDWRPKEGMFTMRELVSHIPQAEASIIRSALAGSMQEVDLDLAGRSAEEIAAIFDKSHRELAEEVSKLTLDELNEEVEAFGRRMRRIILLWAVTEHEIHHRGQLFTYYRLAGVEPPGLYE